MPNHITGDQSAPPKADRGLALVTVLWVLMLLALIAASFTRTTRTEVNLTRNLIENAEAEVLADAGVYRAVLALLELDKNRRWRVDGRAYRFDFHDGVVWISIQDEGGKIDLNKGKDRHLEELFRHCHINWAGRKVRWMLSWPDAPALL